MRRIRFELWYLRLRPLLPAALAACVAAGFTLALLANLAFLQRIARADASTVHGRPAPTWPAWAQDPGWVARKQAFQVSRQRHPGDNVLPVSCVQPCYRYPDSNTLDTSTVALTLEPGSTGTDAAGHDYRDHNMTRLCGPGAAANTVAFWNDDIHRAGRASFADPAGGVTTTWDGDHNRSYLLSLAWQTSVPTAPHPGMMDTHDPSWGVTLYAMRDTLNWEASGHDTSGWRTFFYTLTFWDQSSGSDFHARVVDDLANARAPVVPEVNARLLPNWPHDGDPIFHFITIVGYDDVAGLYYYTDSCGHSTGCGAKTDGGVNSIGQAQLWAAITAVPVNRAATFNAGDGGFVW